MLNIFISFHLFLVYIAQNKHTMLEFKNEFAIVLVYEIKYIDGKLSGHNKSFI